MEELQKEIERIRREQEELVFGVFDEQTAWETGNRLRQIAREKGYAVAISITLNRRRLFACAMAGTTHQRRVDQAERKYRIQVFQELL